MRAVAATALVLGALAAAALTPAAANAVDVGDDRPASSVPAQRVVSAPGALPQWSWPVPPPIVVVAPFRAPPTPYAAGHRGIDLAVDPGAAIRAAARAP